LDREPNYALLLIKEDFWLQKLGGLKKGSLNKTLNVIDEHGNRDKVISEYLVDHPEYGVVYPNLLKTLIGRFKV